MHEKFVCVYCCFKLRPKWFPVIWKAAFDLQKFPHPWPTHCSCCWGPVESRALTHNLLLGGLWK